MSYSQLISQLMQAAGLSETPTRQELLAQSRKGVSSNVLDLLSKIAPAKVLNAAIAPATTRARWKRAGRLLTGNAADGALRLVGLIVYANNAFGDTDKAIRWLSKPKLTIDPEQPNATPFEIAESEHGARLVEDRLNQIAHGIYA